MRVKQRPAFASPRYWESFVESYVNTDGYWYQPKGETISWENVSLIQKRLHVLKSYTGSSWSAVQGEYTSELESKGLIRLRKKRYTGKDRSALARMNKVVFEVLGLAWVEEDSKVFITSVGNRFLECDEPASVIENQVLKYQLSNPCIVGPTNELRIFPHLYLLEVLLQMGKAAGISHTEYMLFVARSMTLDQVDSTCEGIERFRRLSDRDRSWLTEELAGIPVLKKGKYSISGKRSSIYNTIRLNKSYALSFFGFPAYVQNSVGRLSIPDRHWAQAQSISRKHLRRTFFTEFRGKKDWFAHYGDESKTGSLVDALDYYETISDVERARGAFEEAKRRRLPEGKGTTDSYMKARIQEKILEDVLASNLSLLEPGMTLVERQYQTLVGRIDLLARDTHGRLVVVELKKGKASDKVFGQLQRYRGWVANEYKTTPRGIIVARDVDEKLRMCLKASRHQPLELFEFDFRADFRKVPVS